MQLKEKFGKKYKPITRFKLKNIVKSVSKKVKTKLLNFLNPSRKNFKYL